jgi:hypothetical protein
MAFTRTTLSAAQGLNDTTALVASLTGLAVGDLIRIDNEMEKIVGPLPTAATTPINVLRGQEGTIQAAHPVTAGVIDGKTQTNLQTADWGQAAGGAASPAMLATPRPRKVISLTAAATLDLPTPGTDLLVILNGTAAIAVTVPAPTGANDGDRLTVIGNGKAAHTVIFTTGLGAVGATADTVTFAAAQQQGFEAIAAGVAWVTLGTNTAVAGAGATINGAGLG